ncbi:MAG TPA: YciI family protein, partial [Caulobacteraceae bacterium]|nr:YciI family protein [Caulobacteraceae bacterium]
HVAYLQSRPGVVRLAGPLLDADGEMCGSLLVVELENLAAAQAFSDADPYALAGLFERVEIRGWRLSIGEIA